MAFLVYKKSTDEPNVRYERVKPLKLAGATGLIARHVKSLQGEDIESWQLETPALLELAGANDGQATVLFDVAGPDASSVCLYELVRVCGSCRDTVTNLVLDFRIVLDANSDGLDPDFADDFEVPRVANPKRIVETLALTGGSGGGDWKWSKPAMQIGATVAQPHHSGPPCPNCTCGRKVTA